MAAALFPRQTALRRSLSKPAHAADIRAKTTRRISPLFWPAAHLGCAVHDLETDVWVAGQAEIAPTLEEAGGTVIERNANEDANRHGDANPTPLGVVADLGDPNAMGREVGFYAALRNDPDDCNTTLDVASTSPRRGTRRRRWPILRLRLPPTPTSTCCSRHRACCLPPSLHRPASPRFPIAGVDLSQGSAVSSPA